MPYFIISIISYLLGSIPSAFLVVKLATGKNILDYGTGNVGTMNTHRVTNNKWLTVLVLCSDLLKGYLAWFLAINIIPVYYPATNVDLLILLSGFFVILGHNYSVFLRFKGGKGLATGAGFFLGLNPILDLVWILSFLVVTGISKYMVLGQMLASICLVVYVAVIQSSHWPVVLAMAILVVIRHWSRMTKVLDGSEPKMYYKIRTLPEDWKDKSRLTSNDNQ